MNPVMESPYLFMYLCLGKDDFLRMRAIGAGEMAQSGACLPSKHET